MMRAALAALMGPDISARLASWPVHMTPAAAEQRLSDARAAAKAGLALPLVITRREMARLSAGSAQHVRKVTAIARC
jgi:hypothetical protein